MTSTDNTSLNSEQGILRNGKTIAVKKLSEAHLDDDRFHNEVTYLIGLKLENIVQLIGYCVVLNLGGKPYK